MTCQVGLLTVRMYQKIGLQGLGILLSVLMNGYNLSLTD